MKMKSVTKKNSLALFQDRFVAELYAGDDTEATKRLALATQPGFAVYRNTVFKGCVDALQANYPALVRLVGEEWFRSAAILYARANPPQDCRLVYYGAGFAQFLEQLPSIRDMPYLPGVAKLDRLWLEVHTAADTLPLPAACLAELTPEELARAVLHVSPLVRCAWFDELPVYSIWHHNRIALNEQSELAWQAEGALLARSNGVVESMKLSCPQYLLLQACSQGKPFAEAAQAAFGTDNAEPAIVHFLVRMLAMGVFSRVSLSSYPSQ